MLDIENIQIGDILKCLHSIYLGDLLLVDAEGLYDVVRIDKENQLYTIRQVTRPVGGKPDLKIEGSILETEFSIHTSITNFI